MEITEVIVHLKVGGSYKIVMQEPDGTHHFANGIFQEIQKPARVVYSWTCDDADQKESKVSLKLLDTLDGTEIRLIHDQFESIETRDRLAIAWENCMDKLQTLL